MLLLGLEAGQQNYELTSLIPAVSPLSSTLDNRLPSLGQEAHEDKRRACLLLSISRYFR